MLKHLRQILTGHPQKNQGEANDQNPKNPPVRYPTLEQGLRQIRRIDPNVITQVVDIGAQRQTDFLMQAFPDLHHHLFEPVSTYHADLTANYQQADIQHTLHKFALSNTSGTLYLHTMSHDGSGNVTHAQILPHRDPDMTFLIGIEDITVKRLDQMFTPAELGGDLSYIIKIDVDGLEEEIIDGCGPLLTAASFAVIEASIGKEHVAERTLTMKRKGFRIFDICDHAYYFGQLSQVDLIFINERLRNTNHKFQPWKQAGGKVIWRKWQHGLTQLAGAPIEDPFADDT